MTDSVSSGIPVESSVDALPQISVILLTYRHERYIEGALRSILSQVDAPPHEILVAEDYSPDGTRQVIERLQKEFPGRFQLLDRGRNLGLSANLQDAWKRCRGKYISVLEGDDQWSDTRKLAKVYDAMESHPDWVGCFHRVEQHNELSHQIHRYLPTPEPDKPVGFEDLIKKNWIPTYSSVTYKRGVVTKFPDWHGSVVCGDWVLNVLHAESGSFGYLPDVMTRYLAHPGGMWSGMGDVYRWMQILDFWSHLNTHYDGKYARQIEEAKAEFLQSCQDKMTELRKIEYRYQLFQLQHVAATIRWMKLTAARLFSRSR